MVSDIAHNERRSSSCRCWPYVAKEIHVIERPHRRRGTDARLDDTANSRMPLPRSSGKCADPVGFRQAAIFREKDPRASCGAQAESGELDRCPATRTGKKLNVREFRPDRVEIAKIRIGGNDDNECM